jgi:hypothetical protein
VKVPRTPTFDDFDQSGDPLWDDYSQVAPEALAPPVPSPASVSGPEALVGTTVTHAAEGVGEVIRHVAGRGDKALYQVRFPDSDKVLTVMQRFLRPS